MYTKKAIYLFLFTFLFLGFNSVFAQKDIEGTKDHPLISRYEGSYIIGYEQSSYDQLVLPAGSYNSDQTKTINPEGKVTRILYAAPRNRSALEIFRNYQQALSKAGFQEIYECNDDNCYKFTWIIHENRTALDNRGDLSKHALAYDNTEDEKYLLTKLQAPDGAIYISVYTALFNATYSSPKIKEELKDRPVTLLQIVEEKAMETGKVLVDAEAMAKNIDRLGSVRLYGIHFDIDKAKIKENSESTLAEIGELLRSNPDLKLAVVGHSDVSGSLTHNKNLSEKRAEAVVNYLKTHFNINKSRLEPYGVGPLAPVASNDTKEGRELNRRVELVKLN